MPDQTFTLHVGDAEDVLMSLPAGCVQMVMTSPPYFALRSYTIPGELGSEVSVGEYVQRLVRIFREVHRVLADDGTVWLNLGDSYSRGTRSRGVHDADNSPNQHQGAAFGMKKRDTGLSSKNLIGIPWRVALALQDDGWILRRDIVWAKTNPAAEPVKDRPSSTHEFVFLLSKQPRYFYDRDAIAEPYAESTLKSVSRGYAGQAVKEYEGTGAQDASTTKRRIIDSIRKRSFTPGAGANKRDVWILPTSQYAGAHFATFPPALAEMCIRAGSRPAGPHCDCNDTIETPTGGPVDDDPSFTLGGAGYNRPRHPEGGTAPMTRREQRNYSRQIVASTHGLEMARDAGNDMSHYVRTDYSGSRAIPPKLLARWIENGWLVKADDPCDCPQKPPDVVLDPFVGSGTAGMVALELGRSFIGVDLNPEYVEQARERLAGVAPLLVHETVDAPARHD